MTDPSNVLPSVKIEEAAALARAWKLDRVLFYVVGFAVGLVIGAVYL